MSSATATEAALPSLAEARPSRLRPALRRMASLPIFPIVIWGAVIVAALASPLVAPHDPARQSIVNRLKPPFWQEGGTSANLLGTDQLGRDVFSRIIYGSRVTLLVVVLTVTVSALVGTFCGMVAGYFGGPLDAFLMRLVDFQIALPSLLFGIMLAAVLEPSLRNVIIVIIFFNWYGFARLVRAEVLSLREREYVLLSVVAGASWRRVFVKHLFPNVFNTVMVTATLDISFVIIFESSLSFLGLGVVPPTVSWGMMLADGREFLLVAWWLVAIPGLAIFLVALAGNLFGDWMRDALDPHLRQSRGGRWE